MDAFLDESSRPTDGGLCYVIAAAVMVDNPHVARDAMLKLRSKGNAVLHWHDESAPRRREIVGRLSELDFQAIVAGCHPVAPKRQERARARLLVALANDLSNEGVDQMVIESRKDILDGRDRATIAGAQKAQQAPGIRYGHCRKSEEPLLWVADVVAGVVSMHLAGMDSSYYADLHPSLLVLRELDP